jgi:hypothetical protein
MKNKTEIILDALFLATLFAFWYLLILIFN